MAIPNRIGGDSLDGQGQERKFEFLNGKFSNEIGANGLNLPEGALEFIQENKDAIEALRKGSKKDLRKIIGDLLLKYNNGTQVTGGDDTGEAEVEIESDAETAVENQIEEVVNDNGIPAPPAVSSEHEVDAEPKKDNPGGEPEQSGEPSTETKTKVKASDKGDADTDKKEEEKPKKKYGTSLWDAMAYMNAEFKLISNVIADLLYVFGGGFLILPLLKEKVIHPVKDVLNSIPELAMKAEIALWKKSKGFISKKYEGSKLQKYVGSPLGKAASKVAYPFKKLTGVFTSKKKEQDGAENKTKRKDSYHSDQSSHYDTDVGRHSESVHESQAEGENEIVNINMVTGIQYYNPEGIAELINKTTFNLNPNNKNISTGNEKRLTDDLGTPIKGTNLSNLDNLKIGTGNETPPTKDLSESTVASTKNRGQNDNMFISNKTNSFDSNYESIEASQEKREDLTKRRKGPEKKGPSKHL